jgi:SAM-dependent methyltransferase
MTVLRCYTSVPLADRLHVRIRARSFPLAAVVAAVPSSGRILELGCGRGLVSVALGLGSASRHVLGVDIDEAKLDVARRAAAVANERAAELRVDIGSVSEPPIGPWDAIVIVDVLYLLPSDAQRAAVVAAAAQLAPGGVLVVKEMADRPIWKRRWNLLQELLAVRLLHATAGGEVLPTATATIACWMDEIGLVTTQQALDRGYLHPHALVVGRKV